MEAKTARAVEQAEGGHGQRVSKLLTCEDFGEEAVVPAGDLHLASQALWEWMVLESRDGEAS